MTNLTINITDTSASLYLTSASVANNAISASYALSASWAPASATSTPFTNIAFLTSSTNWIVPSTISKVRAIVVGAGGGSCDGGGTGWSGGGAGAYCEDIVSVIPSTTMSVVVGNSGTGGTNPGSDGGSSSFASLTARGGKGATSGVGGAGGIASGGSINVNGLGGVFPGAGVIAVGGPSPYITFGAGGTLTGTTSGSMGVVVLYY